MTQEVREIGRQEAGESKGFPMLWIGIMDKTLSNGIKGVHRQRKIINVKKIHARVRVVMQQGVSNSAWAGIGK